MPAKERWPFADDLPDGLNELSVPAKLLRLIVMSVRQAFGAERFKNAVRIAWRETWLGDDDVRFS